MSTLEEEAPVPHPTEISEKGSAGPEQEEYGSTKSPIDPTNVANADDDDFEFTIGKILACVSLLSGYMAAVFCIQMVSSILTTINADIGPSTAYAWMVTAQVIPVGVFGPLVGRLGDIYGRRYFIMAGNMFGIIGCVMGATAQSVNVAIGGGIFIGVASACQQLAWSGLGEVVPRKYRSVALGIFELCCAPPGAFGPIMGNAVAARASWRWVYWVPFILNCVGFVMVFLFYRPKNQYIREEGKSRLQEVADLDWVGFALWTAGLLLFLLGISFGGNQMPWKSAGPIAMIILGVLLMIILGFYDAYWPQVFPLFPPVVFRNVRGVTVVLIGTFLFGMMYYSTAVLWPQQVQALYTTDLIKVGWYASALGIAGIISSPIFGWLFTKGHARILFVFIIALGTISSGAMAVVSPGSHIASTILVALMGITVGGGMIVATTMIQLEIKHEYIGIGTSLAVTARNVGGAVGQTIYTTIFSEKLKSYLTTYVAVPLAEAGVAPTSLPAVIGAFTGQAPKSALAVLTPQQLLLGLHGVQQSFVHSLRLVYLVSIAFGVLGTFAVCFCKNVDSLMTNRVDIKLDEGAKLVGVTDTGEGYIIRIESQEKLHHHHNRHGAQPS